MSFPRQIDEFLVPRVSVAVAAKYLGVSPRWIQREISEGRLRAIDVSRPGAARAHWGVAVSDLRALVVRCELAAERRLEEAKQAKEATEPKKSA